MVDSVNVTAIGRVQKEVARLEALDQITPQDLERFRKALPSDPATAEIVEKSVLKWPLNDVYEYVSPSPRQSGYWRVAPDRSTPRSAREKAFREQFAKASKVAAGVEGTTIRNGKEIPLHAALVADALEGIEVDIDPAEDTPSETAVRAARRLQTALAPLTDTESSVENK